jgi:hypothetical protein
MKRHSFAGVGALAFGILTWVAFVIANPPGGDYKVSDVADYLAKGHRPAVFISVYVMLLSAVGLLLLLSRLRDALPAGARATTFWALGIAVVTAWFAGYALVVTPTTALAFSGGKLSTLDPTVAYAIAEGGWALMYGAAALLLGVALILFAAGPVGVPPWVRWSTLVAGIASIAGLAWFPFFLVYLWAIVLGVWLLVAGREPAVPSSV